MLTNPPLVIDTGVISRYSKIGRFDVLQTLYSNKILMPTEVIMECIREEAMETCVKKALDDKWIVEGKIDSSDYKLLRNYSQLRMRFDPGESSVLAIAQHNNWSVGSDDMRASARFCRRNGLQLIGSLGILYDAFDKSVINQQEADKILSDMIIKSQYDCPVSRFSDVYSWFKFRRGRQLF